MDNAENSCVIDLDQEWLGSLRKNVKDAVLRKHRRDTPPTIFRVPATIRQVDPGAYAPNIVSFGPYHRDNPALKAMDELKLRYLQKLLLRNPKVPLEAYVKLVKELEPKARASYSEDIDIGSDAFVEMLLLDGSFIIELFLMQLDGKKDQDEDAKEEDPILTTTWTMPLIEYDMLMLENQIPFSILWHVYDLLTDSDTYRDVYSYSIVQLAQAFFNDYLPSDRLVVPSEEFRLPKYFHLLHFFHSCIMPEECQESSCRSSQAQRCNNHNYKPLIYQKLIRKTISGEFDCKPKSFAPPPPYERLLPAPGWIPSVTRLKEAGVAFETKAADSFLDVEFRDNVMAIPVLKIYDQTNSLFRNLIAFEQCFPRVGTYFGTYAMMMDCLVRDAEDVALLHRYGCIVSGLGSDDSVARLFNGLRKDAAIDHRSCYLAGLFVDVKVHCDSRWNKWRAKLMHDYFSNPWSVVSLIAALVLIFLTVVQACFALLSYVFPRY